MTDQAEIVEKFWKALKSDRTFMLGLAGTALTHARPMTANFDGDERSTIWIFTATDTELAKSIGARHEATGCFAAKGHDLFATMHGVLYPDGDRAVIDRLWNPFIAAWFKGKDDPRLALLRFEPETAEIWLNDSSLLAGIKILLGKDPKKEYQDKVAQVVL